MSCSTKSTRWLDGFIIIGTILFTLGCIATTHHTARTNDPGQFSVSGSYLQAENLDESEAESIDLLELGVRYGIVQGLDAGLSHTWDLTTGNESAFNTIWGDLKFQVTNRNNALRKPTLSVGLLKGYIYNLDDPEDDDFTIHVTSLPLTLDYPINETFRPFLFYRYELIHDDFFPESISEDIRHTIGIGTNISLRRQSAPGWHPKLGVAIGRVNSLTGEDDDDSMLILNLGLTVNSPVRNKH